jgi:hypothetical protein
MHNYFMENRSGLLAGTERYLLEAYICRWASIRKQGVGHTTGPTTFTHLELYQ